MERQQVCKRVMQAVFILSLPFFTLMELNYAFGASGYIISLILTLLIGVVISRRVTECVFTQTNKRYLLVAAVAAIYIAYIYAWQGNGVSIMQMQQELLEAILPVAVTSKRLAIGLMLASLPSIYMLIYWMLEMTWSYVVKFVKSLDSFEKRYLGIVFLVATVGISFFYLQTAVCYRAVENGIVQIYDVLYTTDSADIYGSDCFLRILSGPNDIRQPLLML